MKQLKHSLTKLSDGIENRINNKFDCIIMIEGDRGTGKSTLAIKLALLLRRRGLKFSMNKHIAYARRDVIRLLATQKKTVIVADEMINVTYNRDFYESAQKQLIKGLNMYRDSCNVYICCIPKFEDLDSQLKSLVKIRIYMHKRGVAIIHMAKKGMYVKDIWDTKNNKKIEDKAPKNIRPYKKLSTYRGFIKFNDLTEKQRERYEYIKETKRNSIYNKENDLNPKDQKTIFVENLYNSLTNKNLIKKELVLTIKLAGYDYKDIRRRLNEALREAGFEERTSYFLKEAVKKRKEKREKAKRKKAEKRKIRLVVDKKQEKAEKTETEPVKGSSKKIYSSEPQELWDSI